jgi:hypothetical protein
MIKRFFFCILAFHLIAACSSERAKPDVSQIDIETRFHRFDSAFFQIDTTSFEKNLDQLKANYAPFFSSGGTLQFWKFQRTDGRQVDLAKSVQTVLSPFEKYNQEINLGMKHIHHYFPQQPKVDFYSYISNLDFNLPVLYVDSNNYCFVATDMYLGQNNAYYRFLPSYLAYFREPKFMIRDCLESILIKQIEPVSDDESLLDHMIYHGKLLYALQQSMPNKSEALILRYPKEKMEFCLKNEKSVWAYFVENQLLFSKKLENLRYFIQVAPFSKFGMKFDNQSPGRIGQWVGLQIVTSYMNQNKNISIQQLFKEQNAQKILQQSGYKP